MSEHLEAILAGFVWLQQTLDRQHQSEYPGLKGCRRDRPDKPCEICTGLELAAELRRQARF